MPGLVTFAEHPEGHHVMAFRLRESQRDPFSDPPALSCTSGMWVSPPSTRDLRSEHREYCRIIRGRVRVADRFGRSWEFNAGQAFLLLRGFAGQLCVIESTEIFRVTFKLPDASALDWCKSGGERTALGQLTG